MTTTETNDDYKQYIIIRKDLSMRQGKSIVQATRACEKLLNGDPDLRTPQQEYALDTWLHDGVNKKIAVYVNTEAELLECIDLARTSGWLHTTTIDIGLTEFKNCATLTCCVIGPERSSVLDQYFGHLKLM